MSKHQPDCSCNARPGHRHAAGCTALAPPAGPPKKYVPAPAGHCNPAFEEHAGYKDTGRTANGTSYATGKPVSTTLQVWSCQCGAKTMNVDPNG